MNAYEWVVGVSQAKQPIAVELLLVHPEYDYAGWHNRNMRVINRRQVELTFILKFEL